MADNFASPKIPVELRPLYLGVLQAVTDALREPGHAAGIAEATARNAIRRLFEGCEVPLRARVAQLEAELADVRDELAFVAARATEH